MVLWNGINLRSKGIIVEKIPQITKAKRRFNDINKSNKKVGIGIIKAKIITIATKATEKSCIFFKKDFLPLSGIFPTS